MSIRTATMSNSYSPATRQTGFFRKLIVTLLFVVGIASFMALLKKGDHLLYCNSIFGSTQTLIKKYEGQQGKVRNNREYDSISKEMEFQNLDIQLSEKRIKEYKAGIITKNEVLEQAKSVFEERSKDLNHKKKELKEIIAETEKDEEALLKKSKSAEGKIEERLINAYKSFRN